MGVPPFLMRFVLKDYYKILEVERSAGIREIRKAYRILAKEKHPDSNPDADPELFIELIEAYTVIGDPVSKTKYDKLYDHYILGKPISNERRFHRREDRRRSSVHRKSAQGKARGEKRSHQSKETFEKETNRWAFFDFILVIFQGALDFLGALS